jgi:hypothetical protein
VAFHANQGFIMRYYVQSTAPKGNNNDQLGTDDLQAANDYAIYLSNLYPNEVFTVVERFDTVVTSFAAGQAR